MSAGNLRPNLKRNQKLLLTLHRNLPRHSVAVGYINPTCSFISLEGNVKLRRRLRQRVKRSCKLWINLQLMDVDFPMKHNSGIKQMI